MRSKHAPRSLPVRSVGDLIDDIRGGTVIEYALIAGLIAVALIGALSNVREALIGLPMGAIIDAFAGALS